MIELNKIYNMDCKDGLKLLDDNSIDLIITSPPYNLGEEHHTGNNKFKAYSTYSDNLPENDYQYWQKNIINECYRVLKGDGSMFYNHKNRIRDGKQISPYEWLLKTEMTIKQELVWFNGSQNFDKCRFYPMTERIYWLSKSTDTKFNNNINHHDYFEWTAEGTDKQHKRAFPLKMVKDIINCFPPEITVLDIFMGSGTTATACINTNRNFIGFEIDRHYCEMANKRIAWEQRQQTLF